jgi:hypothetical protein
MEVSVARSLVSMSLVAASMTLAGCVEKTASPDAGPPQAAPGEAPYERTTVSIDKDGTMSIHREAGFPPPRIDANNVGITCDAPSIQLFDHPDFTGNEICFIKDGPGGAPPIELALLTRPIVVTGGRVIYVSWSQAVRSYRATLPSLGGLLSGPAGVFLFTHLTTDRVASPEAQAATTLRIETL